jgi:hypothetical protein
MLARDIAISFTSLSKRPYFLGDTFWLRDELLALGFTLTFGCGGTGIFRRRESLDRSLWKISLAK